jgi:hypothetical protein
MMQLSAARFARWGCFLAAGPGRTSGVWKEVVMTTEQGLGLITGILFGFLLQKGRVLRFDKQVGAMLLKDMTILKFMLSAILVGMVGILILANAKIITLGHKPMNLGAVLVGGGLFGIGWAIMGFCPGTSIGALGEGRWHAIATSGCWAATRGRFDPQDQRVGLGFRNGLPETLGVPMDFGRHGPAGLVYFEKKRQIAGRRKST